MMDEFGLPGGQTDGLIRVAETSAAPPAPAPAALAQPVVSGVVGTVVTGTVKEPGVTGRTAVEAFKVLFGGK